ncbi:MAG: MFS transporter [Rhodocyclaceae bacterium]
MANALRESCSGGQADSKWPLGLFTVIRIEGATYAAFSATRKIAQAIGGALPAFLLGFTGYAPNLAVQSAAATFGIWANISLIPAIAFLLAGLTMFMYPVSDRHFRQLVEDIRSRAQRSR